MPYIQINMSLIDLLHGFDPDTGDVSAPPRVMQIWSFDQNPYSSFCTRKVALTLQRLCFIVSAYSGVRSRGSPGTGTKCNFWMRIARKRKTSCRAITSPMQRRFPIPKTIIFSPSILFSSVPSALRKRSGLKLDGSFHCFLWREICVETKSVRVGFVWKQNKPKNYIKK